MRGHGNCKAVVERCDPDSAGWRATLAHALVALFGDRTCSKRNVCGSCFGAEWCDRKGRADAPSWFVADLMRRNTCYAAMDESGVFLGLAAVSPSNVIFTFCVAERARGMGAGTAILDRIVQVHGGGRHPLELTVAAPTRGGEGGEELGRRHGRLVALYGSYGFERTGHEGGGYTQMVRRPWKAEPGSARRFKPDSVDGMSPIPRTRSHE